MARLPTYTAGQVGLDAGQTPRANNDGASAMVSADIGFARAVGSVGAQVSDIGERMLRRQTEDEEFKARIAYEGFRQDQATKWEEQSRNAPADGAGVTETFTKRFTDEGKAWLEKLPPRLRDQYGPRLDVERQSWTRQAAGFETKRRDEWQTTEAIKATDRLREQIDKNPDPANADANYAAGVEIIDKTGLPPIMKQKLREEWERSARTAELQAKFRANPGAMAAAAGVSHPEANAKGREGTIIGKLTKEGLSPLAAAAIVGNLIQESGLRTSARNPGDGRDGSDSIGLAQWNAERARRLKTFAAAKGKPADDLDTQVEFLALELKTSEGAAFERLQRATTVEEATAAAIGFFRPKGWTAANPRGGHAWDARLANATRLAGGKYKAGDPEERYAAIPYDDRMKLVARAEVERNKEQAAEATRLDLEYRDRLNTMMVGVIDGKTTIVDVEAARKDGWLTDAGDIQKVMTAIEKRDGDLSNIRNFHEGINNPNKAWNPFDKADKDAVDAGFEAGGRDLGTLERIAERTGMLPSTAATALRGAIVSNDPARVTQALNVAARLLGVKPTIFAGVQGGNEIEKDAAHFRYLVDQRGRSAAEAVARIMEEKTPEYQEKVKGRLLKTEDVDKAVRSAVSPSDLASEFNEGWTFLSRPDVGYGPARKQEIMDHYALEFRDAYQQHGDAGRAKAEAMTQLKKVWGTSRVSGSPTLMRYPPERAPVYAGIEDISTKIANAAIADIKETVGQDVKRDKMVLIPIPGATGDRFKAGEPPLYTIQWEDAKGVIHMSKPGWYADPVRLRADQTAAREKSFREAERTSVEGEARRNEQTPAVNPLVPPELPMGFRDGAAGFDAMPGAR